ncbi:MAG: hypothetical protein ACOCXG_03900 [Nanoarchaeota archaeon]
MVAGINQGVIEMAELIIGVSLFLLIGMAFVHIFNPWHAQTLALSTETSHIVSIMTDNTTLEMQVDDETTFRKTIQNEIGVTANEKETKRKFHTQNKIEVKQTDQKVTIISTNG